MVLNISHHFSVLLKVFNIKIESLVVPLLFLCFSNVAFATNLTVAFDGELSKAVKRNINSYLGALPKTDLERSAFIYSAKEKAFNALNSLGYYQADISIVVEKDPWKLILIIKVNEPTLLDNVDIKITGAAQNDPAFTALLNNIDIHHGDKLHHGKYEKVKSDLLLSLIHI